MTRLLFVVLHKTLSKLEAVVERAGVRRKVTVRWETKDQTDVPPPQWFSLVVGELDIQDAEAFAKARGVVLE